MGISNWEHPVRILNLEDNDRKSTGCPTEMKYVTELNGHDGSLISELGGKAFNLNRLISMAVKVPPSFTIKTNAYRVFTEQPELQNGIQSFVKKSRSLTLEELQSTTKSLRDLFFTYPVQGDIANEVKSVYNELMRKGTSVSGVSVRSSATSEDLAEASFAGLHSTYLNVSGIDEVLTAVRGCWASLWSAGAVTYRERCGFDHSSVAMGVVVQHMVPAEKSGVMFTSNPVNANRREVVINSIHGLGEGLVSGKTTPDVFIVDRESREILKRNLAFRDIKALPNPPHEPKDEKDLISLTDHQIHELVELGLSIEEGFGEPQDIEWTIVGNEIHILQSRPVFTLLSRHDIWRQRSPAQISIEKPVIEKRLKEKRQRVNVDKEARYLKATELRTDWDGKIMPNFVDEINEFKKLVFTSMSDLDLASSFRDVVSANRAHFRIRIMVGGLIDSSIKRLEMYLEGVDFLTPEQYPMLLVGFPNKDSESDAALQKLASQTSPEILNVLRNGPEALKDLEKIDEGPRWITGFKSYLENFGHMSSAKWDVMAPTYSESPSFLLNTILNYAQQQTSQETKTSTLENQREDLIKKVIDILPTEKRCGFVEALKVAQENYPLKDDRDFFYLMSLSQVRRAFLEAGRRLLEKGIIESIDDIFFLKSKEVSDLIAGEYESIEDVGVWIKARRLTFRERAQTSNEVAVESLRHEHLSVEDGATVLSGLGISPGVSTGRARVVRSLHEFPILEVGDILVSPAATPAWAPVLGIVSGIVTDVGGILSHGGILAREYGIPAVANTGIGTSVIKEGQIITVDGGRGRVYLHQTMKRVEETR